MSGPIRDLTARYEQYFPTLDETALANGRSLDEAETWALALCGDDTKRQNDPRPRRPID